MILQAVKIVDNFIVIDSRYVNRMHMQLKQIIYATYPTVQNMPIIELNCTIWSNCTKETFFSQIPKKL